MTLQRLSAWIGLAFALPFVSALAAFAAPATTILNVSYDVSRELYKDINPAFAAKWKAETGEDIEVRQSHGGSSKQALAVANGLEADVVTFNQAPDIDVLVSQGGLVSPDWRTKFPNGAAPYTTTTIFLVRKGNPKGIKDWNDLIKPGVGVIVPNPKTSGNGRYTYLAAWGYALKSSGGDASKAKDFVKSLFANVPVLDGGGRGATTTFAQNGLGDVLVTFENEAPLIEAEFGAGKFEAVYPSLSVEAEPPVAIVDKVAGRRGTRKAAQAYLDFLFSPSGQQIIVKHGFRPRDEALLKANAARFPAIETFSVDKLLGGWANVQKEHFSDGAIYDQIASK